MTQGRELPVCQNGSHEARQCMFPNGHSVTGEKDYLSPLAAVLEAWKLRGEVIAQDFDHHYDPSALHFCVHQSSLTSRSFSSCSSQKPRHVRRCNRCVRFDDYIEFATNVDEECELFNTFVSHDALQDWTDKPWFYRPKPPSRRFSWRKLTNFVYPFCSWYGDNRDGHSVNEFSEGISLCCSPSDAGDDNLPIVCDDVHGSNMHDDLSDDHSVSSPSIDSKSLQDVTNTLNMPSAVAS